MSKDIKTIAVFTSGGDAPGMNACVRAVVRTARYHKLMIYGIKNGYEGMIKGELEPLFNESVANIIHRGGTILRTARSEEFRTKEGRKKAADQLHAYDIDGVIAIGGNGTFTGANIFYKEHGIPFVGVPGTIDNDLFGTDYTIGFDTAVNTAIEAIDKIRDTADSHNRLFFIEVMGRDAGYIALNSGIGSGAGNILLPETNTTVEELIEVLDKGAKRKKLFNIVIVAEGNKNGNAFDIAKAVNKKFKHYDTRVTNLGHIQRGGSPTCHDRVLASRLGYAAVEGLLGGKENTMVGVVNDKLEYTDLAVAIKKHKPLGDDLIKLSRILSS